MAYHTTPNLCESGSRALFASFAQTCKFYTVGIKIVSTAAPQVCGRIDRALDLGGAPCDCLRLLQVDLTGFDPFQNQWFEIKWQQPTENKRHLNSRQDLTSPQLQSL